MLAPAPQCVLFCNSSAAVAHLCVLLLLLLSRRVCLDVHVLPFVLQHPLISSDPVMLCAAAQVCKAWREAVQQCGARNTGNTLSLKMPLPQLRSFAMWLPKHAALVNSITAKIGYLQDGVYRPPPDLHVDEAQRLLHRALQLAGTMPAPPTAAMLSGTAAVAASVRGDTAAQQQRWRLASFRSNLPSAELLAALPTYSLTRLDLYDGRCRTCSDEDNSSIAAALAPLSSLQHLLLMIRESGIPVSALAGVAQLSRLTALELYGHAPGITPLLEQLLCQQLPLCKLKFSVCDPTSGPTQPVLDIKHLTTLTELSSCWRSWRAQPPVVTALPVQLKQLQLVQCSVSDLAAVMPLKQLQRLDITIDTNTAGEVARVAAASPAASGVGLHHTQGGVCDSTCVAAAAAAAGAVPG
jgi:hypothetical protein